MRDDTDHHDPRQGAVHGHTHRHGHGPGHDHAHGYVHGHTHQLGSGHAFALGAAANGLFTLGELVAGWLTGSMALLADAAHNAGDVLSLLLAWGAAWLVGRQPTRLRTYGYGRSSILAALANALLLMAALGGIAVEAARRLMQADVPAIPGLTVALVAVIGIAVNGGCAWLFARDRHGDLNARAAFLHMVGDMAITAGVAAAGLLVAATGLAWIDPLVSLIVAGAVALSGWALLREALDLSMDKVPEAVDEPGVRGFLAGLPGVVEVHDLHIWGLSTTSTALTAHLVCPDGAGGDDRLLLDACEGLRARFGIDHATLQVERGSHACALAPAHVI